MGARLNSGEKIMELRPHQERAISMLRQSLAKGYKRPILGACCSFGKTITALYILTEASKKGKKCIFFCDRVKLVQQAINAFRSNGIEVGVIMSDHELRNPNAMIQIASIQSVARMRRKPEFDLAIVDECHTHYKTTQELMDRYSNVCFIGLSATPYSKGLGKAYNDLVVPVTTRQLLDQGYLCPVKYYGGATANVSGLKTKRLPTGAKDYDPKELERAIDDESEYLTGDIILNYTKLAYNRPAIAFSPSVKHSKYLVEQFNKAGIPAVHIDGYMKENERQDIYKGHERGDFKILSCSMLLGTGYDAPHISCLIDCYPSQSKIQFVQRAGRIMRLHDSKTDAIYLDHAGNIARHGFPEDIVPDSLDDGEKPYNENNQIKEKKESKAKDCPQCFGIMVGIRCACGYEIPIMEQIKTTEEELTLLKKPSDYQDDHKEVFLGGLELYAQEKGFKAGWVAHSYKKKFGEYPQVTPAKVKEIHPKVKGFIKHLEIRQAKGRQYAR